MRCILLLQMRYNVVSTVVMILLYQRPRNFIFARCAAAPGPERIFRCLIAAVGRAAHMRVYTYTHVYVVSNGTQTPKKPFRRFGLIYGFLGHALSYIIILYNTVLSVYVHRAFVRSRFRCAVRLKKNDSV